MLGCCRDGSKSGASWSSTPTATMANRSVLPSTSKRPVFAHTDTHANASTWLILTGGTLMVSVWLTICALSKIYQRLLRVELTLKEYKTESDNGIWIIDARELSFFLTATLFNLLCCTWWLSSEVA